MTETGMLAEADAYESLPTHSLTVHLVAGAAAGIMEHCVMYPIDCVKTRMQSLCDCPERRCRTPLSALYSLMKREGTWRPMRGVNAVATGAVPAHALYFTVYEKLKHRLTGGVAGHQHTWAYAVSGGVATLVHDAVMNPAEVIKQRMQMAYSPYRSCTECVRHVYYREGIGAFYRSYTTQLVLNVPFQSIHFVVYEFWQQILNPKRNYDPLSHLVSGGLAGGIAAAVTTPLDVVKTVLNTQQSPTPSPAPASTHLKQPGLLGANLLYSRPVMTSASEYGKLPSNPSPQAARSSFRGILNTMRQIHSHRGFVGFFSGLQARVMFQVPATGIAWSVYEMFKYALSLDESAHS